MAISVEMRLISAKIHSLSSRPSGNNDTPAFHPEWWACDSEKATKGCADNRTAGWWRRGFYNGAECVEAREGTCGWCTTRPLPQSLRRFAYTPPTR